jgi:hypothetical protein
MSQKNEIKKKEKNLDLIVKKEVEEENYEGKRQNMKDEKEMT